MQTEEIDGDRVCQYEVGSAEIFKGISILKCFVSGHLDSLCKNNVKILLDMWVYKNLVMGELSFDFGTMALQAKHRSPKRHLKKCLLIYSSSTLPIKWSNCVEGPCRPLGPLLQNILTYKTAIQSLWHFIIFVKAAICHFFFFFFA